MRLQPKLRIFLAFIALAAAPFAVGCDDETACHLVPGGQCAKSKFIDAKLNGMDLRDVDFTDADFSHADLSGCDLTGANFTGATLVQTNFAGSRLHNTKLDKVVANGASFRKSKLKGASLDGAVLDGADFSEAEVSGSSMKTAHVAGADFRKAALVEVDMTGATFETSVVQDSTWKKVTCPDGKPLAPGAEHCPMAD